MTVNGHLANGQMPPTGRKQHVWGAPVALMLPVTLTVLAIWLPFGFSMTALIEGWGVLGTFADQHLFFLTSVGSPMQAQALRPLTIFPQALAYFLDPDSFFYWHVLLALALIVKGAASAHLMARISHSVRWGALMGVLVLVYPADTMQLSFRSIHINWALALLLVGSSLFVEACRRKHHLSKHLAALSAATFLFLACCMYEASLPLIVVPLLAIYAIYGVKGSISYLRINLAVLLFWLASAAIYVAYALVTAPKIASYETSILSGGNLLSILIASFPKLFSIGALRALLGGWVDAARMVGSEFNSYSYLALAAAVIVIAIVSVTKISCLCWHPSEARPGTASWRWPLRTVLAGAVMTLLGYAPFLVSGAHLAISQRTFLFATPGAAMVWVGLLIMLWKLANWPAIACASLLIFGGLGAQLVQFHHYVRISQVQRTLLKSIMQNFDGRLGGKTLLILDGSNQLGQTWMFGEGNLRMALSYLYGHSIGPVEVCRMPNAEWEHADSLARKGSCEETASEWILRPASTVSGPGYIAPPRTANVHLAKSDLITVRINPDGSAVANPDLDSYRRNLMDAGSTAALRYRNVLLAKHETMDMFRDVPPVDQFDWNFGKWWSLEVVVRGTGWREPEWTSHGLFHESDAWKADDRAALYFDISLSRGAHVINGRFGIIVNEAVRQSMVVVLNGVTLPVEWGNDHAFQTKIPAGLLRLKNNEIAFQSISDQNYYGLSAQLIGFKIRAR
ncbi:MAG: hypothetical protein ABI389_13565 [Rhodanobacter sp.]